uniref:neural/ectodermal development factor IMP-L2-like isoform X2 n=1 Tax=Pristiophorus japonicus TaxID=55135 RepID=UPI00398E923C
MLYESISAPRIKSHPDAIEKGVNLNLTCTIVKGTEGRFWWEKDSEKIVNNSRHSVLESGTVLTVTEITSSDCGSYKCVVNNDISREEVHFNMSGDAYPLCNEGSDTTKTRWGIVVAVCVVIVAIAVICIYHKIHRNR